MVEQDAVAAVHPVALAVVFHNPEAVLLGDTVRRARIERRGLLLRHLLHHAKELRSGRLVDAAFFGETSDANGFQQTKYAHGIDIGGEFRHVERHLHMALGGKVVNLVRLYLGNDSNQ